VCVRALSLATQLMLFNLLPFQGGGTVDFVGPKQHTFVSDIEEREKAGTPGTLQVCSSSLFIVRCVIPAMPHVLVEVHVHTFINKAFNGRCRGLI